LVRPDISEAASIGVPRPVERTRAYYPALDGIRGFAFLLVFLYHYLDMPWGWVGVEIFFVLSGFLITGILYDSQDEPHRIRNFYVRRSLRIFPLYFATLLIVFSVCRAMQTNLGPGFMAWAFYVGNWIALMHPTTPSSPYELLSRGYLQSRTHPGMILFLNHFWTLCVEEQFYLVWPAVVFTLRKRRRIMTVCIALIFLCPLARLLALHLAPAWLLQASLLNRCTPLRLDAFMFGGLLALVRRGSAPRWLPLAARCGLVAAGLAAIFFAGPHLLDGLRHHPYAHPAGEGTWILSLLDLASLCLIVEALCPGSIVYRALSLKPLTWIGRISYGAYVFHYLLIAILGQILVPLRITHKMIPTALLGMAVTLVLAWFSFCYFESPFIRLKQRLAN
jgi:peptidoglycan/LPS O-acetylase OafA/YrhL